jgi:heme/copper-type cytochrome/quinol oxidase subunit 4
MDNTTIILLASPLIAIQLILMVINLLNLYKKKKTKYLNKALWVVIIFLGSLIGNIVYILAEGNKNGSDKD